MKKGFITDQTITIRIPANPTLPAEVIFTPGPYCEEAKHLSGIPESGWERENPPSEKLEYWLVVPGKTQTPLKLTAASIPIILPKTEDDKFIRFLVDRKALIPKPLRKSKRNSNKQ